jgi:hypothetical protein
MGVRSIPTHVLGTCDVKCARLERGAFPKYWPFRAEGAVPPSTERAKELVAKKFGSPSGIRTYNPLVNRPSIH